MLTDYHLHLRPDDVDATAEEYFTTENVGRYLDAAAEAGIEELGVSEHIHRFTEALEIWDHPFWRQNALDDLGAYCEFVRSTPLRLGIEMDYVPGREDRIANVLDAHEFDYVVGSVHFVGGDAVDWDDYDVWRTETDPDRIWQRYFEVLAETVRSGLYDILAHPDLVKYWGHGRPQPERDVRFHYEPAIEAIAETRSRSRSRPRAGASRSTSSIPPTPSPRCASTRGRCSRSPPTPTCPRTSAMHTTARWRRCAAGA